MGNAQTLEANASVSCYTHIPTSYDPSTPPNVVAFDDLNCTGLSWQFPPTGSWRELWKEGNNNADNRITSIVVPPGTRVTSYHHGPGNDEGLTKLEPGVYKDLRNKLDVTNTWGSDNTMSRFLVERTSDYQGFLRDCCQGILPASECANYAGPAQQACQPSMRYHCSLSLDWHKKPICKQWGASFQAEYDSIAQTLCKQEGNKADPYCACFNPKNPDMARPSCFDAQCSGGHGAYQTKDMKDAGSSAGGCGVMCSVEIAAAADKSVLITNNEFVLNCGNDADAIRKEIAGNSGDPMSGNAGSGNAGSGKLGGDNKTKTYLALGGGGIGLSVILCCCMLILFIIIYMMMKYKYKW